MTVGAMAASRPSAAALLPLLKPLLLLLPAFFIVLLLSLSRSSSSTNASDSDGVAPFDLDVDVPAAGSGGKIRIRSGYRSYKEYIARQLNKTLDPRLRSLWTTRDWERKVAAFAAFFRRLQAEGLLHNGSQALCVGARTGQEVAALRRVGVADSIGLDLVPSPPLVVKGDFHRQPFPDESFDFEFSNVFDHALLPARFVGEVERTLRPGGVCVLHVAVRRRGDRYSANDLFSVDALVGLFRESELVEARKVDGFGLDTEVVMRKKSKEKATRQAEKQRVRRRMS
ncbi:hypothetical protein Taro_046121 [Colocasia esculenta]|uniref:Methyltransferase type 11 domain-containing protein n=1 Tax=Colocasia esculenta TaxID=4460 RepID=A0A843X5Q0_COLES|nr:hypothetical protein [Colocasia esculenta]